MTHEDKKLLLVALCEYLPYGVNVSYKDSKGKSCRATVEAVGHSAVNCNIHDNSYHDDLSVLPFDKDYVYENPKTAETYVCTDEVRMFLRPMSSMTEEENNHCDYLVYHMEDWLSYYEYLNSRYLDHRGLIEKGLALEAPEDMYKIKELKKTEQEEDTELTDFESALFSAFSDAWQEYLSGKEVNVSKWTKEHSPELLEVAREQEPAWSERDENEYNHTLKILKLVAVEQETNGYNNLIGSINWLQSLKERYTWKPSDEQMEALLKLEEMHVLEHEKNQENAHLYMVIKSLREQLLKLKKGE